MTVELDIHYYRPNRPTARMQRSLHVSVYKDAC